MSNYGYTRFRFLLLVAVVTILGLWGASLRAQCHADVSFGALYTDTGTSFPTVVNIPYPRYDDDAVNYQYVVDYTGTRLRTLDLQTPSSNGFSIRLQDALLTAMPNVTSEFPAPTVWISGIPKVAGGHPSLESKPFIGTYDNNRMFLHSGSIKNDYNRSYQQLSALPSNPNTVAATFNKIGTDLALFMRNRDKTSNFGRWSRFDNAGIVSNAFHVGYIYRPTGSNPDTTRPLVVQGVTFLATNNVARVEGGKLRIGVNGGGLNVVSVNSGTNQLSFRDHQIAVPNSNLFLQYKAPGGKDILFQAPVQGINGIQSLNGYIATNKGSLGSLHDFTFASPTSFEANRLQNLHSIIFTNMILNPASVEGAIVSEDHGSKSADLVIASKAPGAEIHFNDNILISDRVIEAASVEASLLTRKDSNSLHVKNTSSISFSNAVVDLNFANIHDTSGRLKFDSASDDISAHFIRFVALGGRTVKTDNATVVIPNDAFVSIAPIYLNGNARNGRISATSDWAKEILLHSKTNQILLTGDAPRNPSNGIQGLSSLQVGNMTFLPYSISSDQSLIQLPEDVVFNVANPTFKREIFAHATQVTDGHDTLSIDADPAPSIRSSTPILLEALATQHSISATGAVFSHGKTLRGSDALTLRVVDQSLPSHIPLNCALLGRFSDATPDPSIPTSSAYNGCGVSWGAGSLDKDIELTGNANRYYAITNVATPVATNNAIRVREVVENSDGFGSRFASFSFTINHASSDHACKIIQSTKVTVGAIAIEDSGGFCAVGLDSTASAGSALPALVAIATVESRVKPALLRMPTLYNYNRSVAGMSVNGISLNKAFTTFSGLFYGMFLESETYAAPRAYGVSGARQTVNQWNDGSAVDTNYVNPGTNAPRVLPDGERFAGGATLSMVVNTRSLVKFGSLTGLGVYWKDRLMKTNNVYLNYVDHPADALKQLGSKAFPKPSGLERTLQAVQGQMIYICLRNCS